MADVIRFRGKDFTFEQMKVLEKAGVLEGQKNDPASLTLTAPALQGPFQGNSSQFGIFSSPGIRPQRFSALQRPYSFFNLLALEKSDYTAEILGILTGQTASTGTNATGFCGNPPTVGQLKQCAQIFSWGDYYIKTDLNSLPQMGQLRSRADIPGQILNQGPTANPLIPDIMFGLSDTRDQLAYELFRIGVDLGRTAEVVGIQGTAGGTGATLGGNSSIGWTTQFAGLGGQIKTGYRDQLAAGTPLCAAADSAVVSFNAIITGNGAQSVDVVTALTSLYRGLKTRAARVGMANTRFAIVMRMELFQPLTDVWACNYSTYACAGTTSAPNMRDGMRIQELRTNMYANQYLLINGEEVPVVFSDGLEWDATANNVYNSDIYIVPVSWEGMPLLKMQYFPMDNEYINRFANFVRPTTRVINNGMFVVGQRDTGLCLEFHFAGRFRMILEAPFLAGRLNDLQATYIDPSRNALPGNSLFSNGGSTYYGAITPGSY